MRSAAAAHARAKVIVNAVFTEGCSGSCKAGMATIDPRAEAVMVLLGDQPGESAVIDQVAEDWRTKAGTIALTSYRGRRGHPMVFARELFDQLRQLSGDKAAWKILDAHPTGCVMAAVIMPSLTMWTLGRTTRHCCAKPHHWCKNLCKFSSSSNSFVPQSACLPRPGQYCGHVPTQGGRKCGSARAGKSSVP